MVTVFSALILLWSFTKLSDNKEVLAVRPATLEDAESLLALSDQLESAASSRPYAPRSPQDRLPRIKEALATDTVTVLMAVLGNAAVGYVNTVIFPNFKGRKEGKVVEIVVAENMRGRSVGTRLFEAAINDFEARGVEVFEVTTGQDNELAQQFYEKQGLIKDEVVFRGRI